MDEEVAVKTFPFRLMQLQCMSSLAIVSAEDLASKRVATIVSQASGREVRIMVWKSVSEMFEPAEFA